MWEVLCKTECESTFADGLCADLAGEVVETAEKVPVYLLQAFDGADFDFVYEIAFKQNDIYCPLFADSILPMWQAWQMVRNIS